MEERYIKESDICKYLYNRLIKAGYSPSSDEVLDIAGIMFDFLVEVSVIEGEIK